MTTSASLVGCRILVVEDETLIAVVIEEILQELGCVVVGVVARLDAALRLARDEVLDLAVLDVTIRGGHVELVAEQLLPAASGLCWPVAMAISVVAGKPSPSAGA